MTLNRTRRMVARPSAYRRTLGGSAESDSRIVAAVKPSRLDGQQTSHYDSEYAAWADPISKFGGWANRFKFEPFVQEAARIVDYGCGAGIPSGWPRRSRKARDRGQRGGTRTRGRERDSTVADTDEVPDGWADVIISNSVLEHVLRPYDELLRLRAKVRPGGRLVFVMPHGSARATRPTTSTSICTPGARRRPATSFARLASWWNASTRSATRGHQATRGSDQSSAHVLSTVLPAFMASSTGQDRSEWLPCGH